SPRHRYLDPVPQAQSLRWGAVRGVRLSVLIPVFNEQATIRPVVDRLRSVPLDLELIAVDDASTDGSGVLLDELQRAGCVHHVVHHPTNRGKGAAIRSGIARVTGGGGRVLDPPAPPAQAGARIWEMPISYSGRTYAEGKKIMWRDGCAALVHILRYNLFPPAGGWRRR